MLFIQCIPKEEENLSFQSTTLNDILRMIYAQFKKKRCKDIESYVVSTYTSYKQLNYPIGSKFL